MFCSGTTNTYISLLTYLYDLVSKLFDCSSKLYALVSQLYDIVSKLYFLVSKLKDLVSKLYALVSKLHDLFRNYIRQISLNKKHLNFVGSERKRIYDRVAKRDFLVLAISIIKSSISK